MPDSTSTSIPRPSTVASELEKRSAIYKRRLLLAKELGDARRVETLQIEFEQFLASWDAGEDLQRLIPSKMFLGVPASCSESRQEAIRSQLTTLLPGQNDSLCAHAWYCIGEYDKAVEALETLASDIALEAKDEIHWARCLLRHGRWADSLGRFERAQKLAPKNPEAVAGAGLALGCLGRPQEALVHYRRALHMDPCYAEVQFLMAECMKSLRQYAASPKNTEGRAESQTRNRSSIQPRKKMRCTRRPQPIPSKSVRRLRSLWRLFLAAGLVSLGLWQFTHQNPPRLATANEQPAP